MRTPLYSLHKENGARFVPFEGWEMPVQFKGIKEEHRAVRERAGLFDVSHMGEIRVKGPQSIDFLNTLATNDASRAADGQGIYSPMCYETGGVVDDLIIYRFSEENFLLVVNASNIEKDFEWMKNEATHFACEVSDESDSWALLALQGPRAGTIMEAVAGESLDALKRFHFVELEVKGTSCLIAGTGYTGEAGFEIFCAPERAETMAGAILDQGGDNGLQLAGLGCRDSLRLEAGYPLYGHEISEAIDPLTAGLRWTVKFKKEHSFLGKLALLELRKKGLEREIRHFIVEDRRMAREGMEIFCGESRAGKVVSGAYSPILERPICSALIDAAFLDAEDLALESRGHRAPLRQKKPPLHI